VSRASQLSQHQLETLNRANSSVVTETLRKDDSALFKLQTLADGLGLPDTHDNKLIERSKFLCATLAEDLADQIRCRLDRIFLYVGNRIEKVDPAMEERDLEDTWRAELSSLYTDIAAVAEMTVNHEFEGPLLGELKRNDAQSREYSASVLEHTEATINYLVEKAEFIINRTRRFQSYRTAIRTICDQVWSTTSEEGQLQSQLPSLSSPCRNSNCEAPSTLQNQSFPTRRDPQAVRNNKETKVEPHQQLLRSVSVALPLDSNHQDMYGDLTSAASIRVRKINTMLLNVDASIQAKLASRLENFASTVSLLVDALYLDSIDHSIQLFEKLKRSKAIELQDALADIGNRMSVLDLDLLHRASTEQESFVDRWTP